MQPARARLAAAVLGCSLCVGLLAPRAQAIDDLRAAVERVQRETGGRILSAETVRVGRGQVHRVKVLTPDGRVRVVSVHGEPLRERGPAFTGPDPAPDGAASANAAPAPEPAWRERDPPDPPERAWAPITPDDRGFRREPAREDFDGRPPDPPAFERGAAPGFERREPSPPLPPE